MSLRERICLTEKPREWLSDMATAHHYLHRPVHYRAVPFGWAVTFDGAEYQADGMPSGFIVFSSVHFTKLRGEFGYAGLPTKWQVLQLSRLWLHDSLPRNSETVTIAKALKLVQRRWLQVHPPRYMDEPYHIVKVISYADRGVGHEGTIYKASNFREYGRTSSAARHKTTRGVTSGSELICYIYDLESPRWEYQPAQMGLELQYA